MNRTRGSADFHGDPIASVLGDPYKRALAAQILGQAYVIALNMITANKDAVDSIATQLVAQARALRRRAGQPARTAEAREAGDRLPEGRDVAEDVIEAGGAIGAGGAVRQPSREPTRADRARHSRLPSAASSSSTSALALVLGSAVGALVVGLRSSSSTKAKPQAPVFNPRPAASSARSTSPPTSSARYRLADGEALVDVLASRNTLQDGNLGLSAGSLTRWSQPLDAQNGRDSQVLRTNDAIQYSLCGHRRAVRDRRHTDTVARRPCSGARRSSSRSAHWGTMRRSTTSRLHPARAAPAGLQLRGLRVRVQSRPDHEERPVAASQTTAGDAPRCRLDADAGADGTRIRSCGSTS